MKRIKVLIIAALVLAGSFTVLAQNPSINFLGTAKDCAASTTLVNATDFTSVEINVTWSRRVPAYGAITVTFTRAAGSSSEVNFEFQASCDNGTSWSTAYYLKICVPTNETAASNIVRVTKEVQFWGVTHIRLYRIVNNDASNNLTVCNASLSFGL